MSHRSVRDAQQCVLQHAPAPSSETVPLHDALGRVLAEEVTANRNHPPYPVSAMDGYALHHADIAQATADSPVTLSVVDDIRAGTMPSARVLPGEAARIMTGAPVPPEVDTVVRVEDSEPAGDHRIAITAAPARGANIRPMGENLRKGEMLLSAGTEITPGVLAILAMVKQRSVTVFARPSVAILSTGDELEAIDEPIDERKIPDANSHAIYAQCKALGIEATLLGIAGDNPGELRAKLAEGLNYDILLASGGVSVGHHDFVRPMLDALGITMRFWRVAMRPGHPLAFGSGPNGQMVFGLPGNPVASMVCFEQFVTPALRRIMGHRHCFRHTVMARLTHDLKDRTGRTHFVRVRLTRDDDGNWRAESTGAQGSGIVMSMAEADGLMPIPADCDGLKAGAQVEVQLLHGGF